MVAWIHPDAPAEMEEAARFYEGRATGLGPEFVDEVERVIRLVVENP